MTPLPSFGRLLRRLRGRTPLADIATRMDLHEPYLMEIETGAQRPDETLARRILREGFALPRKDIDRLILGLYLYDLGLKDNDLRQLVIALIRRELPPPARAQLKELARRYLAA
jgi:transcriptional regulator with XRE-family HTH domain